LAAAVRVEAGFFVVFVLVAICILLFARRAINGAVH
jgi:hypothetical protein